ncbi:futalosine hydrolase [Thermosulfurimonas marina]|uniref:Futalosine hydrolase n=1 Tax=Thermosulfurimonas marina TaxID=2047767 RepID=A0A6H1WTH6_9BACT|nr:futalosine hydrolase [Thermosulfurimonas marina]QJA06492.1 futalosine hydrolase [Thermosulfurimonas marina]
MLLLVPTETEASPLREAGIPLEIVGFGPVESALRAAEILSRQRPELAVLAGLAGAYPERGLAPGDLVVATEEVFGDLALCFPEGLRPLSRKLPQRERLSLRGPWLEKAITILEKEGQEVEAGPLVTVCCASRDVARARLLALRHRALAENMEGFGVALAAERAGVPLLELRAISNLLEKPEDPWEIEKALYALKEALLCLWRNLR